MCDLYGGLINVEDMSFAAERIIIEKLGAVPVRYGVYVIGPIELNQQQRKYLGNSDSRLQGYAAIDIDNDGTPEGYLQVDGDIHVYSLSEGRAPLHNFCEDTQDEIQLGFLHALVETIEDYLAQERSQRKQR